MKTGWFLPAVLLGGLFVTGALADGNKVEKIGACTLPEVPEVFRTALMPDGMRVSSASGPLCEVWFRKVIPLSGSGKDYSAIAEGTFLGIVRFVSAGADCRGQVIKPGAFSLRYYTIPVDGNHMGVSPTSDFALLAPIGTEKDPGAIIPRETFIPLSARIAGANHPVVLYLPAPSSGDKPAFHESEESLWILDAMTRARSQQGAEIDFPIAIVLIGKMGTAP